MSDDHDRNDWFACIFITAAIFLVLGYAYRYAQDVADYERGYTDAITEMTVIAKGEICHE